MTEQFDDQGLFRKGIRFQGVARGPWISCAGCGGTIPANSGHDCNLRYVIEPKTKRDEETGRLVPKHWMSPSRGVFNALLIGLAFWAGIAIAYYGLVLLAVLRGTR